MADDTMQLPPGYEDAKPVQPKLQLPPGYEDAQPVAAKTVYAGPKAGQITPPPAAQQPVPSMNPVSVVSGAEHTPPPASFKEKPIQHGLPTDEDISKVLAVPEKMAAAGEKFGKTAAQAPVVAVSAMQHLPETLNYMATPKMGPAPNLEQPEAVAAREHPVAMGIAGGVGGMAGSMVADPRQWPLLFVPGEIAGPVIGKLISGAFAANMAKGTIEGAKQLGAEWDNISPEERAERITQLGLSSALAGIVGVHATGGEPGARSGYNAVRDVVSPVPETAEVKSLAKETAKVEKVYDAAKVEMDKYKHSLAQKPPVNPPQKVLDAYDKAARDFAIAKYHEEVARDAASKATATRREKNAPAIAPQPPTKAPGKITAPAAELAPEPEITALGKLGEKKPPMPPINVKTPGQIQPETFPQTPTEAPKPSYGRIALPNEQGTVGTPRLLTEGTPEGPQVPKGGLPKIKLPETEAPKPQTGTAADLKALKVKEGKVIDTDESPEGRIGRLLQEALKTDTGTNKNFPAAKVEETPTEKRSAERRKEEKPVEEERRQSERRNAAGLRVDEHGDPVLPPNVEAAWQSSAFGEKPVEDVGAKARQANPEPTRAETKAAALPKEEQNGYAAKKEEVVPAGEDVKRPVKSAEEYHPAVEQKVNELSDENLKKLAQAHGLNPDEYDFKASDERRHRTERDQLAKDITEQIGEDEKINLGRAAEAADKEPGFANRDQSAKGRADRAAKLFPRLRGPVDEYGNPKVSGGAPDTVAPRKQPTKTLSTLQTQRRS